MNISPRGLELLKAHEGLRLKAYPDPASGGDPWTIGYGHTAGVQPGDEITPEQAEQFLRDDLAWVYAAIEEVVRVPLAQEQFDALCSLIFNIGGPAFKRSTLLRRLNQRDYAGAADEFNKWTMAAGRQMPGLVRRRADERELFLSAEWIEHAATSEPESPQPDPPRDAPGASWPFPESNRPERYAPAGEADPTAADPSYRQPDAQRPSDAMLNPEATMPLHAFVAAALPSLIQHAPALIRVFGNSPQAERNAKAAETVAAIAKESTKQPTIEGALQEIESNPAAAAAYREAVHQSLPELLSVLAQATEIDEKTRSAALDRNLQLGQATGGRWLWLLGAVVIIVLVSSMGITTAVLFLKEAGFTAETKALLIGQVVIAGFLTVLQWLFGSTIANRLSQQASLQGERK